MALFNHTKDLLASGDIDLANLKAVLTNGYVLDATETDLTAITAAEVSGNGWTSGGEPLANAAVAQVNTSDARLDADDVSVTATGGDIGPADGVAIVDATNSNPLIYQDFASAQTAGDGTAFNLNINASGLISIT